MHEVIEILKRARSNNIKFNSNILKYKEPGVQYLHHIVSIKANSIHINGFAGKQKQQKKKTEIKN